MWADLCYRFSMDVVEGSWSAEAAKGSYLLGQCSQVLASFLLGVRGSTQVGMGPVFCETGIHF